MANNAKEYADELYRGLSVSDWIVEGMVSSGAFQFEKYNEDKRDDGFCELSINWNDDNNSLDNLRRKEKLNKAGDKVKQFPVGYCILNKDRLDSALNNYFDLGMFRYERDPIIGDQGEGEFDNPYHGNLLLSDRTPKTIKKMIQSTLAIIAGKAIEWDNEC